MHTDLPIETFSTMGDISVLDGFNGFNYLTPKYKDRLNDQLFFKDVTMMLMLGSRKFLLVGVLHCMHDGAKSNCDAFSNMEFTTYSPELHGS